MGQNFSKSITTPTINFRDCLNHEDNTINIPRCLYYRRKIGEEDEEDEDSCYNQIIENMNKKGKKERIDSPSKSEKIKRNHTRSVKRHKILVREPGGSTIELKPEDIFWYRV